MLSWGFAFAFAVPPVKVLDSHQFLLGEKIYHAFRSLVVN
jgi:hypothetical protein